MSPPQLPPQVACVGDVVQVPGESYQALQEDPEEGLGMTGAMVPRGDSPRGEKNGSEAMEQGEEQEWYEQPQVCSDQEWEWWKEQVSGMGGALTSLRWTVGKVEQQVAGLKRQMPDVVKTMSEGYFAEVVP